MRQLYVCQAQFQWHDEGCTRQATLGCRELGLAFCLMLMLDIFNAHS